MNNTCPALRAICMAARCCFCSYCQRCPSLLPPQGPDFFFFPFFFQIELVKLNTQASLICNLSSLNFYLSSFKLLQFFKLLVCYLNSNPDFNFKSYGQVSPKKKKNQKICQNLPLDFTTKKKVVPFSHLFHFFPLNLIILERKL